MGTPLPLPEAVQEGICPLTTEQVVNVIIQLGMMISGKELYGYQLTAAFAIIEDVLGNGGNRLTVEFSRQSGKSEVTAVIICGLMVLMPLLAKMYPHDSRFVLKDPKSGRIMGYVNGFKIGVYAPKKDQADIIFNRVKSFFMREESAALLTALEIEFTTANGKNCILSNGSRCSASTANEGASIEGDSWHLIVTDETQKIADTMISKSILPMGASTNASVLHIGTASIGKCYFYRTIVANNRTYALGGKKLHYEVDYHVAAAENPWYAKHCQMAKQSMGENSDEFKMSYRNIWILERGQFIEAGRLRTLYDFQRGSGDYFTPGKNARKGSKLSCIAGIDFAKQHDRTVLTIGVVDYDNPTYEEEIYNQEEWRIITHFAVDVIEWVSFDGDDYEDQYNAIMQKIGPRGQLPYPLRRLALDATGCGASITDRFKASLNNIDIIEYVFTLQSKNDLYRNYMRMTRNGEFRFPADKDTVESRDFILCMQEHVDLEKTYINGMLQVKHPDEPTAHDDYPDSGALLAWAGSSRPTLGEIEIEENNIFRR